MLKTTVYLILSALLLGVLWLATLAHAGLMIWDVLSETDLPGNYHIPLDWADFLGGSATPVSLGLYCLALGVNLFWESAERLRLPKGGFPGFYSKLAPRSALFWLLLDGIGHFGEGRLFPFTPALLDKTLLACVALWAVQWGGEILLIKRKTTQPQDVAAEPQPASSPAPAQDSVPAVLPNDPPTEKVPLFFRLTHGSEGKPGPLSREGKIPSALRNVSSAIWKTLVFLYAAIKGAAIYIFKFGQYSRALRAGRLGSVLLEEAMKGTLVPGPITDAPPDRQEPTVTIPVRQSRRRTKASKPQSDPEDLEKKIAEFLGKNGKKGSAPIVEGVGAHPKAVKRALAKMASDGALNKIGQGKATLYELRGPA